MTNKKSLHTNITVDFSDQFLLRVKRNSALDKIMRAFLAAGSEPISNAELARIGGQGQWRYQFQWMAKLFDNVTMTKYMKGNSQTMGYAHPVQIITQSVGTDITPQSQAKDVSTDQPVQEYSSVKWPQMPPLCETMDEFREPTWYKTMRAMVERGKHISLAGPPGVGKDTAVIQLAAEMGKPLVTIGGDAGFRRRDLTGSVHIANGSSFLEVGEYAAAAINGWWVLLTEVNAADADALIYINSQLAPPYVVTLQGKAYPVHHDFRIFVSYNPGLIGTKPLPQSFKDRFYPIQVPFFTSFQLRDRLEAHGLPQDTDWSNKIVEFGVRMWDAYEKGLMRYQITTRRLQDAIIMLNDGIESDVRDALKQSVLAVIDSPVEYKAAEKVLQEVIRGY